MSEPQAAETRHERRKRRNRQALIEAGHQVMARKGIDAATMSESNTFEDPAQVYAFGIRNVMKAATTDHRWRWLLRRSEVIADAMYRVMGPYAIRDICNAVAAGRYQVEDPEMAWRQATHAIVGFSLAVCDDKLPPGKIDEAVVNLLGMVGVPRGEAWEIARRPCPDLPRE